LSIMTTASVSITASHALHSRSTPNSPPTPPIHLLSLHDALPISTAARDDHRGALEQLAELIRQVIERLHHQLDDLPDEFRELLEDRKSTRLNSSHRTKSYAVFCL